MTRATCFICGKPADGLVDISRCVGERRDVSSERFYLCSDHLECGLTIAPGQARMAAEELRTTYYGVWSGKEWWYVGENLFYPTMIGLAKAQAMVANTLWKNHGWDDHWEARAIGEDGLPTPKPSLTEEQKETRSEATSHMCGESPPVWVSMEPFCPDCHAWLEMQDDVHVLLCPGCGKTLQDTEAPRRGRRNHERR